MNSDVNSTGSSTSQADQAAHDHGPAEPVEAAFLVVGIGASAGGLESLAKFLLAVPAPSGAAFVIVQHLSPAHESMMPQLLRRYTDIPVTLLNADTPLEPERIFLLPPGHEVFVEGDLLKLERIDKPEAPRLVIDRFLESLGQHLGERSVAIVMSGTGSDGAKGVRAVSTAGGRVLVESPETAKFTGMPRAAIETGVVDEQAPAELIWSAITAHRDMQGGLAEGGRPDDELASQAILARLQRAFGIDFSVYKPTTVNRRIERRMGILHIDQAGQYVEKLDADPAELEALHTDLLIGVTRFFRDPECFNTLKLDTIPRLLRRAPPDTELRMWVAGCATGEEAYSLAMVVDECIEQLGRPIRVKILATDVHEASLAQASAGVYDLRLIEGVSPQRMAGYFERQGDTYRVGNKLRGMVIFASHNMLRDAPFTNLDLIMCRNVLIYFQKAAQERVQALFDYSLNNRGVLVLGPSETLLGDSTGFDVLDSANSIFEKSEKGSDRLSVPAFDVPRLGASRSRPLPAVRSSRAPLPYQSMRSLPEDTLDLYDALLDEFGPAGFLVDHELNLLDVFGNVAGLLSVPERRPSPNLLDMMPQEIAEPLSHAIRQVRNSERPFRVQNFDATGLANPGWTRISALNVRPMTGRRGKGQGFLIEMLTREMPRKDEEKTVDIVDASQLSSDLLQDGRSLAYVNSLEDELRYTREYLSASTEENESANEELQAANEELTASNEELQATNEELNSVNEELHSVNAQYQSTIAELRELNQDMEHLISSTDVGTVFLDRSLRIRRFTPTANKIIQLSEQDIGRPVTDFAHRLVDEPLYARVEQVLVSGESYEQQVVDEAGTNYLLRIVPYLDLDKTAGAVINIIDVDQLIKTRKALVESRRQLQDLIDSLPILIASVDASERFQLVNRAFEEFAGESREDIVGATLREVLDPQIYQLSLPHVRRALSGEEVDFEFTDLATEQHGVLTFMNSLVPWSRDGGESTGYYAASTDISALKQAENRYRALIEKAAEAILVVDARNKLRLVNDACVTLLGYSQTELLAKDLNDLLPPGEEAYVSQLRTRLTGQASTNTDEWEVISKTGEHIRVEVSGNVYESTGEWLILMRDVTERRRAEEAIAAGRAIAEASSTAKSEFLTSMSHEIRTPLSAMLGFCEVLSSQVQDDNAMSAVHAIERNGAYLLSLVNEILDLSKIEAGQLLIEVENFSIVDLLSEVLTTFQVPAEKKGLALTVAVVGEVPESIRGDRLRLRQILLNLIGNSVKFTTAGRIDVRARVTSSPDNSEGMLQVIVTDTGPGIPPDRQNDLFVPFTQAGATGLAQHKGTGLGLAISRRLARLMGGNVLLVSSDSTGSKFEVSLPVGEMPGLSEEGVMQIQTLQTDPSDTRRVLETLDARILIVDDEPDIQAMTRQLLGMAGATVDSVYAGDKVLGAVVNAQDRGEPFDAILVDIQLPGLTGYEVTSRLRALGYDGVIVAVTANAMKGEREKCIAAGCDGFIAKPAQTNELIRTIRHEIANKRGATTGNSVRAPVSVPDAVDPPAAAQPTVASDGKRVLVVEDDDDLRQAQAIGLAQLGHTVFEAADGAQCLQAIAAHQPQTVVLDLTLPDMTGEALIEKIAAKYTGHDAPQILVLSGRAPAQSLLDQGRVAHFLQKPVRIAELGKLV